MSAVSEYAMTISENFPSTDFHDVFPVPVMQAREMRLTAVYRYARGSSAQAAEVDGYPNFHHLTAAVDGTRVLLESGINLIRSVTAVDGSRRPAIVLRSSPWKAGHETTPWHDSFDLDHGYVRYYGDHKASIRKPLGSTRGNGGIRDAWPLHRGTTPQERLMAPPILLFRAVRVSGAIKGYVEFCGVAVLERLEHIVQHDSASGRSFANYVFDLALLDLSRESENVDWRWIDDRRDPAVATENSLRCAPHSWRRWVSEGQPILAKVRRRVASIGIKSTAEQQPAPNSPEHQVLQRIYRFYDGQKHVFELLAAKVAGNVLRGRGAIYHEGWLTRGSGDGGTDFVGRLDVGSERATAALVVLGQAKCVTLSTSISAGQIARVVARLRRGWLGVYVTTGVYSRAAQEEMIDDQYPVILIDGLRLAEEVRRMAIEGHAGDVEALLSDASSGYHDAVTARRPEEVLSL